MLSRWEHWWCGGENIDVVEVRMQLFQVKRTLTCGWKVEDP
jgi:hypothetical protein